MIHIILSKCIKGFKQQAIHVFYDRYIHYPATLMTTPMPMHAATATAASPHTAPQQQPQDTTALASPPPTTDDKELKELTAAVEQKLDLSKQ